MGKKNKSSNNLGRSLIKDRFGSSNKARRAKDPSLLHTAEVDDGYDWGRLNLQSVTEESSFQEFLSTAVLAGTEFQAEKLNITFVNPKSGIGLLSKEDRLKVKETQDKNKQLLGIPRRPKWDENTTAEQLQAAERDEFLDWRRRLAVLQEVEGVLMTPYEKNLEFWRQLWRVVEKSDVVVQIVDARNPLLFRCEDLEHYVTESNPNKMNLILLNKADFLTSTQRSIWAEYFSKQNVRVAFFSATLAAEKEVVEEDVDDHKKREESEEDEISDLAGDSDVVKVESEQKQRVVDESVKVSYQSEESIASSTSISETSSVERKSDISTSTLEEEFVKKVRFSDIDMSKTNSNSDTVSENKEVNKSDVNTNKVSNSGKLLSRTELIDLFRGLHTGAKVTSGINTIGLVGYPNVGKSSTINALLMDKKVSVSATPGKTKHFQTLFLDDDLLLCDCPGLVMPSFVFTKAEMVVNGILPIDQMRDHVPPVTLVASVIPRHVLEDTYGLMLPKPEEGEDPLRPPIAEELLNAYGYNRGFMTQNGQPDNPRSARYVLKDFVNGKLLYCHSPPGLSQEEYHSFPEQTKSTGNKSLPPRSKRALKPNRVSTEELDQVFFKKAFLGVHRKGVPGQVGIQSPSSDSISSVSGSTLSLGNNKPWKDHHNKRNKREKLRRVYSHLDQ